MHKKHSLIILLLLFFHVYPTKHIKLKTKEYKNLRKKLNQNPIQKKIFEKHFQPTINEEHKAINILLNKINNPIIDHKNTIELKYEQISQRIIEKKSLTMFNKNQMNIIEKVLKNELLKDILKIESIEKIHSKNKYIEKLIAHRKSNKSAIIFYCCKNQEIEETCKNIVYLPEKTTLNNNQLAAAIVHELGHIYNQDTKKICSLNYSYARKIIGIPKEEFKKMKQHISHLQEKSADIWASFFGKKYIQGLITDFQKDPQPESKSHPSTEARISYLKKILKLYPNKSQKKYLEKIKNSQNC